MSRVSFSVPNYGGAIDSTAGLIFTQPASIFVQCVDSRLGELAYLFSCKSGSDLLNRNRGGRE